MNDRTEQPHASLPSGPGPDRPFEELEDYFVAHLGRYTPEALARMAALAGHDEVVIADAMDRARKRAGAEQEDARVGNLKRIARQVVLVAYGVGFLVLAVPVALATGNLYGLQAPVIIGQLVLSLIAFGLSWAAIGGRHRLPAGQATALASLLAIPVVVFVAFPGVCIYIIYSSVIR